MVLISYREKFLPQRSMLSAFIHLSDFPRARLIFNDYPKPIMFSTALNDKNFKPADFVLF